MYDATDDNAPRVVGTDEFGYAALVYLFDEQQKLKKRLMLSREERLWLHARGFQSWQLDLFALFNPTASYTSETMRTCCIVAEALVCQLPEGGKDFDLYRALG